MTEGLDRQRLALGIKQPWAELILQGRKTLEVRSRPTNIRGPIYLYTSRKVGAEPAARQALVEFGLTESQLPTGLIVGSICLSGCRPAVPADAAAACVPAELLQGQYVWELATPERLTTPQPVRFLPYGVWFYPFQRRQTPQ